MPQIDWTADQAEDVRQILLDRLDRMKARSKKATDPQDISQWTYFIHELRGILAKLEAAYANDSTDRRRPAVTEPPAAAGH
jgi:hypothetical protein